MILMFIIHILILNLKLKLISLLCLWYYQQSTYFKLYHAT